jgi:hypothetical protein
MGEVGSYLELTIIPKKRTFGPPLAVPLRFNTASRASMRLGSSASGPPAEVVANGHCFRPLDLMTPHHFEVDVG